MSEKGDSLESNAVQLDNSTSSHVASPRIVAIGVDEEEFIEGGFEGWKAVLGCSLISAPTVGYHSSHFLSNTPDATLSSVGAVQNASLRKLMAVVAFIAGKLGDRYGYKPFIGAGCLIVFIGQFSASWCNDFWSIFLTQGILQGLGCGLLLPMTFAIPSQWFRQHRGLATGIVIAGASLGGAVTSLVIQIPELHSPRLACLPISIMNFASAIGRTTVGFAADRIGFLNAFILTVSVSAFSQVILWNLATDTYAGVMAFS
ncbi:hypothetical protein FRC06_005724 [Ceratobasidium sp. 370]|nr:hypothetical protein FRC06_005724 [Ceratobasidium sp. 370]